MNSATAPLEASSGRQWRTPSTCSQISGDDDDDDEFISTANNNNNNNNNNNSTTTNTNNNHHHSDDRLRRQLSARSSTSGGSAASSAATNQYLFNQSGGGNSGQVHRQPLKISQYIRSIPVPLVASSLVTLLLLCLLLSECKSLQPEDDQLELPAPLRRISAVSPASGDLLAVVEPSPLQPQQPAASASGANLQHLKRELMGDLLAARAFAVRQPSQQLQQQATYLQSKRQPQVAESSEPFEQEEPPAAAASLEALGSLLFNGASANTNSNNNNNNNGNGNNGQQELSEQEARYLDGEPNGRVELPDEQPVPANLRSSAIELDLSERRQQQQASPFDQQQQQQQQYQQRQSHKLLREEHVKHNSNNNHHHQQQQQPPPQQQQQQYHHLQQQQQRGNHDRAFDIPQIQCNNTEEGFERFACPTPDAFDRYRCIEDRLFCDGYYDCPGGEDEERVACMYYKLTTNT